LAQKGCELLGLVCRVHEHIHFFLVDLFLGQLLLLLSHLLNLDGVCEFGEDLGVSEGIVFITATLLEVAGLLSRLIEWRRLVTVRLDYVELVSLIHLRLGLLHLSWVRLYNRLLDRLLRRCSPVSDILLSVEKVLLLRLGLSWLLVHARDLLGLHHLLRYHTHLRSHLLPLHERHLLLLERLLGLGNSKEVGNEHTFLVFASHEDIH